MSLNKGLRDRFCRDIDISIYRYSRYIYRYKTTNGYNRTNYFNLGLKRNVKNNEASNQWNIA